MKILFYHRFNDLDNIHEFGVVPEHEPESLSVMYFAWVFFYLGKYLSEEGIEHDRTLWLFPYKVYSWEKPEAVYKINGAAKVARLIVNRIKKYIK